jgi:hypothetical protein
MSQALTRQREISQRPPHFSLSLYLPFPLFISTLVPIIDSTASLHPFASPSLKGWLLHIHLWGLVPVNSAFFVCPELLLLWLVGGG